MNIRNRTTPREDSNEILIAIKLLLKPRNTLSIMTSIKTGIESNNPPLKKDRVTSLNDTGNDLVIVNKNGSCVNIIEKDIVIDIVAAIINTMTDVGASDILRLNNRRMIACIEITTRE